MSWRNSSLHSAQLGSKNVQFYEPGPQRNVSFVNFHIVTGFLQCFCIELMGNFQNIKETKIPMMAL